MSKTHTFETIDLANLTAVTGGLEAEGEGDVSIGPGTGTLRGRFRYKRTPYESCLASVTSREGWTPADIRNACGEPR